MVFRATGEEGTDDARDAAFMSLKLGFGTVIVGFTDFLPALDSSAILGPIGETFEHEKLVRNRGDFVSNVEKHTES